ncbi:hypothetical protein Tco_0980632 [Tanacetum coccineum]
MWYQSLGALDLGSQVEFHRSSVGQGVVALLWIQDLVAKDLLEAFSNYGVTCEDEAKRRNSGAKMKTFEEYYYLLLYAVSSKEDTAYQRQLITRKRVMINSRSGVSTTHLYAVCTAGHQSKIRS